MNYAMDGFDDEPTIIEVREELLTVGTEPPALPFPLLRRKRDLDAGIIFLLTAAERLLN